MPTRVLNASALAAITFAGPDADRVVTGLANDDLVAPSLLRFEMANVCVRKLKDHPDDRTRILDAFRMAGHLSIQIIDVDSAAVVDLADATGLTAYDASHLWLAGRLDAKLMILDRSLAEAVGQPPPRAYCAVRWAKLEALWATNKRVTVTLPAQMVADIEHFERNRSRFKHGGRRAGARATPKGRAAAAAQQAASGGVRAGRRGTR